MARRSSTSTRSFAIIWFVIAAMFFAGIIVVSSLDSSDTYNPAFVDSGVVFERMDVEVEWHDDRSCKIKQRITAEFLVPSHGIYIDLPVNSGEKIRGLSVSASTDRYGNAGYSYSREGGFDIVRITVGDGDNLLGYGDKMTCVVTYDYLTPRHPDGSDILALMTIGQGWTSAVENASVTVTYPTAPENAGGDYGVYVAGDRVDGSAVTWSVDGKTLKINVPKTRVSYMYGSALGRDRTTFALLPYEGVEVAYKLPDGTLHNRVDTEFVVTLVIGLVLIAVAVLVKIFACKNKPLTPIVDFYPPRIDAANGTKRRMLPVQMGKIIDDSCSDEDVTSLIFYWASEGYIAIDERDGETYLIKLKDIEPVRGYEKSLFDKIFSYGKRKAQKAKKVEPFDEYAGEKSQISCPECGSAVTGRYCGNCGFDTETKKSESTGNTEVSLSKLRGKIAGEILKCKTAVNNEYRGKFYKKSSNTVSIIISVLCGLFAVAMSVAVSFRVAFPFFNLFGIITIVPVALSAVMGYFIAKYYFKLPKKKRGLLLGACFVLTALLAFATSFVIPTDVMGWLEKIIFVIAIAVPSCIAPFLRTRTPFYDEELNAILGFRDFLRDAEKERLEALLEEDPQYYYNILPYANVLGVSDIWEKKFEELTVPPPTYYRSRVNVFDIYVMTRLTRSFRSDLTYTPPSSSGGSRSGGGFGGGSHGGGFSGGSFGGGGGGRW